MNINVSQNVSLTQRNINSVEFAKKKLTNYS